MGQLRISVPATGSIQTLPATIAVRQASATLRRPAGRPARVAAGGIGGCCERMRFRPSGNAILWIPEPPDHSLRMPFLDLLTTERVRTDLVASDKNALLDTLAAMLATTPSEREEIRAALATREALGSTGLGHGVAIPHGRITGIDKARAAFVRLARPIDFDAMDAAPVDLVAALIVPAHFTDQHLQLLAELAEAFSDAELISKLRNAADSSALRRELAEFAGTRLRGRAWTD